MFLNIFKFRLQYVTLTPLLLTADVDNDSSKRSRISGKLLSKNWRHPSVSLVQSSSSILQPRSCKWNTHNNTWRASLFINLYLETTKGIKNKIKKGIWKFQWSLILSKTIRIVNWALNVNSSIPFPCQRNNKMSLSTLGSTSAITINYTTSCIQTPAVITIYVEWRQQLRSIFASCRIL